MIRPILLGFLLLVSFSVSADIDVSARGLVANDPTYDNTPAFNNLIQSLGNETTLYFPTGNYYFNSGPDIIEKPIVIRGEGLNSTSFIRNYSTANYADSLISTKSTIYIEKLSIVAAAGTYGGGAIRLDGVSASGSVLRDLYITGQVGGTYAIPLTLTSTDSLGIRSSFIENVELFAATIHVAWFVNVQGLSADNLNVYPAGGTVGHMVIQGINTQQKSNNVIMSTRAAGLVYVYTSNNVTIRGIGTTSTNVDPYSTNIRVQ